MNQTLDEGPDSSREGTLWGNTCRVPLKRIDSVVHENKGAAVALRAVSTITVAICCCYKVTSHTCYSPLKSTVEAQSAMLSSVNDVISNCCSSSEVVIIFLFFLLITDDLAACGISHNA